MKVKYAQHVKVLSTKDKDNKQKEKVISISDDISVNYVNVINKITHRAKPHIDVILRQRNFYLHADGTPITDSSPLAEKEELPKRKIRNAMTRKLTGDELYITGSKLVQWIFLTDEEIQLIFGTTSQPRFGTYTRDMARYVKTHFGAYTNPVYLWLNYTKPVKRSVQTNLGTF